MTKLLWLLAPLSLLYGQEAQAPSLTTAAIDVRSVTPGLTVRIDDVCRGVTPLTCAVAPGRHEVRVVNPDIMQWGTADYIQSIVVQTGETAALTAQFPKSIVIDRSRQGQFSVKKRFYLPTRARPRYNSLHAAE